MKICMKIVSLLYTWTGILFLHFHELYLLIVLKTKTLINLANYHFIPPNKTVLIQLTETTTKLQHQNIALEGSRIMFLFMVSLTV